MYNKKMLHIISYANHTKNDGYKNFVNSMDKYNFKYKIIGDGEIWEGFHTKMKACLKELLFYKDTDIVTIVDCFDVMANREGMDILKLRFLKYKKPVVFGAENRIYLNDEGHNYIKQKKWWNKNESIYNRNVNNCSLNGGTVIGYVFMLKKIIKWSLDNKYTDDQLAYHMYLEEYPDDAALDLSSSIFGNYNLSSSIFVNYTGLDMRRFNKNNNNDIIDVRSMYNPIFIHIPGAKIDLFYRMNWIGGIILGDKYIGDSTLIHLMKNKYFLICVLILIVLVSIYVWYKNKNKTLAVKNN